MVGALLAGLSVAWVLRSTRAARKTILIAVIESNTHGLNATPITEGVSSLVEELKLPSRGLGLPSLRLPETYQHTAALVLHEVDVSGFRVHSQLSPVPRSGTKVNLSTPVNWPAQVGSSSSSSEAINLVDNSCRLLTPLVVVEKLEPSGTVTIRVDERRLTLRPGDWFGLAAVKGWKQTSPDKPPVQIEIGTHQEWQNQLRTAVARGDMVSRITIVNYGWTELRN